MSERSVSTACGSGRVVVRKSERSVSTACGSAARGVILISERSVSTACGSGRVVVRMSERSVSTACGSGRVVVRLCGMTQISLLDISLAFAVMELGCMETKEGQ